MNNYTLALKRVTIVVVGMAAITAGTYFVSSVLGRALICVPALLFLLWFAKKKVK